MSIWDDLMGRFKQTSDTVKTEAARRAARATVDQVTSRIAAAADGVLGGLEDDLEAARAARGEPAAPADADAEPAPSFAEQKAARRARAAEELAALKARMGKTEDDDSV
jgi:hypothetical protein